MYCISCETELSDDAVFCPKCGQRAADTAPQGETVSNADTAPQGETVSNADRVMDTGKSPFTLAFAIAFSAQILFSLIDSNFSFLSVAALILEAVICTGCWIVYVNSRRNRISAAGFSVLRIGVPAYLAFSMLEMFVYAINGAVIYANMIVEAAMIIGYLAVVVLRVWCYFRLCVITNHGYKIMKGESAEWNVSAPFFVVMIILAAMWIIGVAAGFGEFYNVAAILSCLAYMVTSVLAVVILAQIRQKQQ